MDYSVVIKIEGNSGRKIAVANSEHGALVTIQITTVLY